MKTLLVGATGLLGPEICRYLIAAGRDVRAIVRPTADSTKRASLANLGVEIVEGDLKDPASLAKACEGVQSVISTASSTLSRQQGDSVETVDHHGQLALVDAARRAGVQHFVFVSFRDNPRFEFPLKAAKRAVEQALKSSGMTYTILQASFFMEVWLTPALGFDAVNRTVRLYGSGESPVSWISYRDVARAAAEAVIGNGAANMTVELGGPDALSPLDVVRMFEAAGAGPIVTETVPEAALQAQFEGATDSLQKSFAALMLQYAAGDAIETTASSRIFPFRKTSVSEFISSQLAVGT